MEIEFGSQEYKKTLAAMTEKER